MFVARSYLVVAVVFLVGIIAVACQSPPVQPTPDIPATVAAQVQREIASQATAMPAPTWTPLPPIVIQATPSPTKTPPPTPTLEPTATPTPLPTPTPESTATPTPPPPPARPTISPAEREEAKAKLSEAISLMLGVREMCHDSEFDGKRRTSDLIATMESTKVTKRAIEQLKALGHLDEVETIEEFEAFAELVNENMLDYAHICLPPGWLESGGSS